MARWHANGSSMAPRQHPCGAIMASHRAKAAPSWRRHSSVVGPSRHVGRSFLESRLQRFTPMSAASLIAAHMNAPYGQIVRAEDVIASLKSGHFSASTKEANKILEALFTEVPPALIMKCAAQVQAPMEMVNHLYQASLALGLMRSQEWEDSTSSV